MLSEKERQFLLNTKPPAWWQWWLYRIRVVFVNLIRMFNRWREESANDARV